MKQKKPGQPRKETKRLNFNLPKLPFDVMAAHMTQQGYRSERGKLQWGKAFSAIAAMVVGGDLILPKVEKVVDE